MSNLKTGLWIAGIASLMSTCTYTTNWLTAPVIKQRDIALQVKNGILTNDHVIPGRQLDHWKWGLHYDVMPGHQLSTTIHGESDAHKDGVIVRSKENTQILGDYIMLYHLNRDDKNVGHIYTKLNIDGNAEENEAKIEPTVNRYGSSVVSPVYSKISASDINTDIVEIRKELRKAAQKVFNEEGYTYIVIDDFIPNGTGLTPAANRALEGIVDEKRKSALFDAQLITAEKGKEVSKTQTDVTVENLNKLRASGLSSDQALQAYQLQLMRDNGKIGTPGVLAPTSGTALVPSGH
jgi:hypothetical protein